MNNKQDKIKLAMLYDNKVSMTYFLSTIVGINHPAIYGKGLTHKDVKKLFPTLKRTSFDNIIDYPEKVYNGDVIMVEDAAGCVVPYLNPHIIVKNNFLDEYTINKIYEANTDEAKKIPNINEINLAELNLYELSKLLKIYNDAGIRSAYRKVHNEIISRTDSKSASNKSKQRVLRKENKNKKFDD